MLVEVIKEYKDKYKGIVKEGEKMEITEERYNELIKHNVIKKIERKGKNGRKKTIQQRKLN